MKRVIKSSMMDPKYQDIEYWIDYPYDIEEIVIDVKNVQPVFDLVSKLISDGKFNSEIKVYTSLENSYIEEHAINLADELGEISSDGVLYVDIPEECVLVSDNINIDGAVEIAKGVEVITEETDSYFDDDFGNYLPEYIDHKDYVDVYANEGYIIPADMFLKIKG